MSISNAILCGLVGFVVGVHWARIGQRANLKHYEKHNLWPIDTAFLLDVSAWIGPFAIPINWYCSRQIEQAKKKLQQAIDAENERPEEI